MKTMTLFYTETRWGRGFSLEEPPRTGSNAEEGDFEAGEYWSAEYALPDGFEVARTTGGTQEFYRNGEHFALTHEHETPVLTNGHEYIMLKEVRDGQ